MNPTLPTRTLKVTPLHPTFCAEISGVDFSKPIAPEVLDEIKAAWSQYGVIVFRNTGLTDESHVEFSKQHGDLDDIKQFINPDDPNTHPMRYKYFELFDASNMDRAGNIVQSHDRRYHYNKGNALWHTDSSFNKRRSSYSLLLAHTIPPAGTGGDTDFADLRTAYDTLPQAKKDEIDDLVLEHSLWHSRRLADPEYLASDFEKNAKPPSRHDLVQMHQESGRKTLYLAAHAANVVGMDQETEGLPLIWDLIEHATQPQYTVRLQWLQPGDMICWDNRCGMHRANAGEFETKYKRDMRR